MTDRVGQGQAPNGPVVNAAFATAWPYLAFAALCVTINAIFSHLTLLVFTSGTPLASAVLLGAFGILGARVSYRNITPTVSIVLRITLSFSVFYLVTSRMYLSDEIVGQATDLGWIVNYLWIVAAAFGLIGLVRPSFGMITLHYMHWQKQAVAALFGVPITSVDYMTIIDTAGLLIIAVMLLGPFGLLQRRFRSLANREPGQRISLMEAVFLAAVALHFGNYFYGALGKIAMGDDPIFWILHNKTQYLILASREVGVNPLTFSDGLVKAAYQAFSFSVPLFNFATVVGQLVCVILIIRPRLAMLTTAYFDLMHVGIFIFTGIFFWKFILLNLAIVLGLHRMLKRTVPALFAAFLVVLVVISPALFHINYFFWIDSRSMNSVKLWAVDDTGREYRVPASYFLTMSVTMNQQRLVYPQFGPFPTWTWGSTRSPEDFYSGEDCALTRHSEGGPTNRYFVEKARISKAVQKYQQHVLDRTSGSADFAYNLYPHHMFSVPWEFEDFRQLDKRRITKFRYSIEAICLGFENGEFTREIVWSDGFDIDIPKQ